MKNILVTGASGLVGRQLVPLLLRKKYAVRTLGTGSAPFKALPHFSWQPGRGELDARCLEGVSHIIHLAGAGIAEARWTAQRKAELLHSRVKGAQLLFDAARQTGRHPATFISASAIGYYGCRGEGWLKENDPPASDFLARLCVDWEAAAQQFAALGTRVVCLRTGLVLAADGGALQEVEKSMRLGVAGYFTQEPLWYSWIMLQDLCRLYLHVLEQPGLSGCYNAVAPSPLPMKTFTEEVRQLRHPYAVLMPVPAWGLRLALGEMAGVLLCSQRVSCKKILQTGFRFQFATLRDALLEMEE